MTISAPQAGKTLALQVWLLAAGWMTGAHACPSWWVAPTYSQARHGFVGMCELAVNAGVMSPSGYTTSPPLRAVLTNGHKYEARSWERPEGIYGPTILRAAVDEFGQFTPWAYSALSSRRAESISWGFGHYRYAGNVGEIGGTAEDLWNQAERGEVGFACRRWTWQDRARSHPCTCGFQGTDVLGPSGSSDHGAPVRADLAQSHKISLQDADKHDSACPRGVYMRFIASEASRMSEPQFRQLYGAEWADWTLLPVYTFDREVNVAKRGEANYQPALPIELSCDFNVDPMCWVLGQHKGDTAWAFGEIVLPGGATTEAACKVFKERFPDRRAHVIVYGDATGRARDTRSKVTDYEIIQRELGNYYLNFSIEVPAANPAVTSRVNAYNARLKSAAGDIRYWVHPACVTGIKDLARVSYKPGTRDIDKTKDKSLSHWSDAEGYRMARLFPVQEPGRIVTAATSRARIDRPNLATMEF